MARRRPLAVRPRHVERTTELPGTCARGQRGRAGKIGLGICRQAVSAQTRFGPLVSDRGVTFRLWAPAASEVSVVLDTPIAMSKRDGWFKAHRSEIGRPSCRERG